MLPIVLLVGIGMICQRYRLLPQFAPAALDRLAIVVLLPAFAIIRLQEIALTRDILLPVAVSWGQLIIAAALVVEIGRWRRWSDRTIGTLLLVVPLANTSFVGLPLVESLLGGDRVAPAVLYDQLGTFLALTTYGSFIVARYGTVDAGDAAGTSGTTAAAGAGALVRRVVTFPPFLGMITGLMLHSATLPDVVSEVLGRLGSALVPIVLISIGMRISLPRSSRILGPTAVALTIRLLIIPAMVFALAAAVGGHGVSWEAVRLESAMPPMISAGVMATDAGLDDELVGAVVGVGLLIGLATVWAWSILI